MTFLKCRNILLFFILMIVIVNPSVAQDSPIIHNSSNSSTMLQKISQMEGPGDMITHRSPPNIPMGDIRPGRLNNLSMNKNVYLFSWDDIPGKDTLRLIKILKSGFRVEWAETATIEKIDGGKTIKVSTGNNSLLLKLNDEKTLVNLTINDARNDEFIAQMNNSKLNIYKNLTGISAQASLLSRNASINIDQLPRAYNRSHMESPGGMITQRSPSNITMGNIPPGRLDNLSRKMNIVKRSTKPINATYENTSLNTDHLSRAYSSSTLTITPVHNMNKSKNYTTIQAAIDDADQGDEIHVDSGTYYENVNVSKQLTLRGIGMPVVDANGSGNAITLTADGIILEGFTATGGSEAGIKVISNNNMLINNDASKNGCYGYDSCNYYSVGIYLSSSRNNTLISNNASNNGCYEYDSCYFHSDQGVGGAGISLEYSTNNKLIGNNASKNGCDEFSYCDQGVGISLSYSNNNTLRGNNANLNSGFGDWSSGYGYGISLFSSSNNTLIGNNANSNHGYSDDGWEFDGGYGYGILMSSSNNNILSDNKADSNSGEMVGGDPGFGYGYGILLSSSNNNTLNGNDANSNSGHGIGLGGFASGFGYGSGISLSSSSNNTLIGNNATFNYGYGFGSYYGVGTGTGISIESSTNNTLNGNNANSNFGEGDSSSFQSEGEGYGISLISSSNNTLSGNNANSNNGYFYYGDPSQSHGYGYGIFLSSSSNNMLIGNIATENYAYCDAAIGISLSSSSNNTLIDNNANSNSGSSDCWDEQGNSYGYGYGVSLTSSSNNTLISNNANSNSGSGHAWGSYGYGYGISLISSSNNTLSGNTANSNSGSGTGGWSMLNEGIGYGYGILLSSSSNNVLSNNNANMNLGYGQGSGYGFGLSTGILLSSSSNNILSGNNANMNIGYGEDPYGGYSYGYGILLSSSSNNILNGNIENSNWASGSAWGVYGYDGILVSFSSNNTLKGNNASNNQCGISLSSSSDNTLIGNNAWNNSKGLFLLSSTNNTLNSNNATSNSQGIFLNSSNFNNITSNNISNSTSVGIKVYDTSKNNTVSRNKITNSTSGMFFVYAFNTTASNNIMENNSFNFGVGGNLTSHFDGNNIDTTNLANGRPIYYIKHGKNTIYDGSTKASTFYCILCNNITLKDLEMSNMDRGVYFWETSNSRLQNITVKESGWGIYMRQSPNNTIKDSKFSTNNLQDYSEIGVSLYSSDNNTFENNTFVSNNYGIELSSSSKNTIYNNYFNNTNNFIFKGTIYKNIWNVTKNPGTNIIGGSYLGGNFWANPAGKDFSQTCLDSNIDGLCDSKYTINSNNSNNSDYLPLKYKSALGITVVSPNGGENWTRGTTHMINWTSTGSPGAYVKIELLKAGVWKSTIISSTLNDGSNPWLIPVTLTPGNDYKIKITSTTNAAYTDTSDNTFTIPTPNITVSTPNGGENWRRGTTQTIKWNSSGSPGAYVKIELMKAGVLNRVIIASTLNDGSHPWLIPPTQAPGTDYMVRITSTTNVAYNDTSDNSFMIPTPSFTVVSPNGLENWVRGTTKTIKWNSTESPGTYVKIELLKPGVANRLIVASTINDGSHPWLIPATLTPGNDYKVKITSTINVSNNDTSDNIFIIPAPSFTVVSPNGSENWTRGTTQTIRWNSTESPGTYVKIELLKPGVVNKVLIASTLNDGSHPWLIPATQALGADYKIKITSTINASVNDTSDNFSIVPPKITVTSPNGGQTWIRGKAYPITWNYTGSPGTYVRIELLKNGLLNRTILTSTPNDKSQSWTIPTTQATGTDYRIRITSTTNAAYNDTSDGNFNISAIIP